MVDQVVTNHEKADCTSDGCLCGTDLRCDSCGCYCFQGCRFFLETADALNLRFQIAVGDDGSEHRPSEV